MNTEVQPAPPVVEYAAAPIGPIQSKRSRWMRYLIGASLCVILGITAFVIPLLLTGRSQFARMDGFPDFIAAIMRHGDRQVFLYWAVFSFGIGLVRGFPVSTTGPLMTFPFVTALWLDLMRGIERHNLFPFEVLMYLCLAIGGSICCVLGHLTLAGIVRIRAARRPQI